MRAGERITFRVNQTTIGRQEVGRAKEHAVTGEAPQTLLVMISNEESAGRIVVELDAFVRFNLEIDRQLAELEAHLRKLVPQLNRRFVKSRSRK